MGKCNFLKIVPICYNTLTTTDFTNMFYNNMFVKMFAKVCLETFFFFELFVFWFRFLSTFTTRISHIHVLITGSSRASHVDGSNNMGDKEIGSCFRINVYSNRSYLSYSIRFPHLTHSFIPRQVISNCFVISYILRMSMLKGTLINYSF